MMKKVENTPLKNNIKIKDKKLKEGVLPTFLRLVIIANHTHLCA
jgi:hypothetical protein